MGITWPKLPFSLSAEMQYICVFIYSNTNVFAYIYTYTYLYSVHKHLWATVWTEMMSKLQASKWLINKQNQSTEATRPATVSPLLPLFPICVCPQANWWPLCGRRKGVGGNQQHLIKTQITETSGQCKKLFLVYISMCACVFVAECVWVYFGNQLISTTFPATKPC